MEIKKYSVSTCLFIICLIVLGKVAIAQPPPKYPIIPYPNSLIAGQGSFVITRATVIILPQDLRFKNEAAILNQFFLNAFGKKLKVAPKGSGSVISFRYDASIPSDEGYGLKISPQQITLSARSAAGIFMAVQTIRQLLPPGVEQPANKIYKSLTLPGVVIKDQPTYAWRGMHLDVSRHFFSIAYLHKFIDILALYKFNKFHLHLTDDQGWRVEIKKYPKLTEQGAWRTYNNQDSVVMKKAIDNPDFNFDQEHIIHRDGKTLYGGYYTQAQLKALVAYATTKHIDIIPEIDMPGHMMAAINQYPFLSCAGGSKWGQTFTTPICPCNETTFEFAENVFKEIFEIFPSPYVHIGGDEVDRSSWGNSDACKLLMKKEGITTTAALQSYFINRMEKFFNKNGKKLIGWDEILEDGISPTAYVMYWRTWIPGAPVKAAKNGNKVIMTPGNPLYFDAVPDRNSLPNVYNFNPIPKGLTAGEAKNIIGAQANIWTELIPSERRADYMYMPRMTALAEVLWTDHKNYADFQKRLEQHYSRLDVLNVHYRLPDLSGFLSSNVFIKDDTIRITKPLASLIIKYTTNGTAPVYNSATLPYPYIISASQNLRLAAFRADGTRGDVYDIKYEQQALAEPDADTHKNDGLLCSWYKGSFTSTLKMPTSKPDSIFNVPGITVPKAAEVPSFGLKYRGYLEVPQNGIYSFYLTCDDGGVLKIAGRDVVNNDGNHPPLEKTGQVALKKGAHHFALDFVEGGGGYTLKLKYSLNGLVPQDVPNLWFKN